MSIRKLFSTIFGMMVLSAFVVSASAQTTEQAAREQARNVVRSQLHLNPGQFLQVQRDEQLEQLLATVVSRPSWSEFIFKVSQETRSRNMPSSITSLRTLIQHTQSQLAERTGVPIVYAASLTLWPSSKS